MTQVSLAPRVIGVDACKKGWVAVDTAGRGFFGTDISAVVERAEAVGPVAVVAIDIPIGLPTNGPRETDRLVRRLVGRRASSVFATPVRPALAAPTHAEATRLAVELTGKGISQQSYALGKKILEVDSWVRTATMTVIEVHPEVSFATIAGHALAHRKSSWAGSEERRALLASVGIAVPADIGLAGEMAASDDVLDAAAACWSAHRYAMGTALSYPAVPEEFGDGGPPAAIRA